jgi:prevent-host-death family protein
MTRTATAKDLRYKVSSLLGEVRRGNEITITMRGRPVAVLKPIQKTAENFSDTGFGIWKKRDDLKDVSKWLDGIRRPRFLK